MSMMKGKGNDGTGNNEERDLWRTSKDLFSNLNKQYNFNFDCCANEQNKKTVDFSNNFEKITMTTFKQICWMNPPFSKAYKMFEHYFKVINKGVSIFRCDNMETKVWQDVILKKATWILIPKGRVLYTPFDITIRGGMTRFPSALIGYNVEPPKYVEGKILLIL